MNRVDEQYQNLLKEIIKTGNKKITRNGGTISTFGSQMSFDLTEGFPLLTTKKVYMKGITHELLWFLNAMPEEYKTYGNTNIKYMVDHGVNIWVPDAFKAYKKKFDNKEGQIEIMGYPTTEKEFIAKIKEDEHFAKVYGDLGPVYGKQWTAWSTKEVVDNSEVGESTMELRYEAENINQIQQVIDILKNNPDSRRIIVSAWNVGEIKDMTLPPCHVIFQFYTRELTMEEREATQSQEFIMDCLFNCPSDPKTTNLIDYGDYLTKAGVPTRGLSLKLTQRSADTFLGVPFNIASYALLLEMFAQCTNMVPEKFIWSGGDVHIYNNHIDQCKEQISREPKMLPKLVLNPDIKNIFDFRYEDIKVKGYDPHPAIKADISV